MKKRMAGVCFFVVLVAIVLVQAPIVWATSLTLYPTYSATVAGNTGASATGFGSGSWEQASNNKAEIYIASTSLFASPVKISDIASISYWTNKSTTASSVDWFLALYTARENNGGDSGSWYDSRLNSEPYFTQTPSVTPNTWNMWSTNDANNPMHFFDQPRTGNFGTYNDPTLAMINAGPVTWGNNVTHDYRDEVVSYFSLQTGSGWANGFDGLVDGLTITLKNGATGTVNFEAAPVPEPGTLVLLGAGMLGLAVYGKRRIKKEA